MEHGENMGALDTKLTALANAIRTKTGVTGALSLDAMANAITDYKNSTTATEVSNKIHSRNVIILLLLEYPAVL